MSESVVGTDPLLDAVVDEFLNKAHPDRVELDERQRGLEEGRDGSWLP